MNIRYSVLLVTLVAVILVASAAMYLTNVPAANNNPSENSLENRTQTAKGNDANNSSAALQPPISFSMFPVEKTVEKAQQQVVQFKIKVPPQSVLPAGYQLVAAIPNPLGPEVTDPFSGKTFRPQNVLLYYWNKPVDLNMDIWDFRAEGGIIIDEMYGLGANSTEPYYVGVTNRPNTTTVGWFKGYPGVWDKGYAEVFKFDESMSYRVWGNSLTVKQELAIIETLLAM